MPAGRWLTSALADGAACILSPAPQLVSHLLACGPVPSHLLSLKSLCGHWHMHSCAHTPSHTALPEATLSGNSSPGRGLLSLCAALVGLSWPLGAPSPPSAPRTGFWSPQLPEVNGLHHACLQL